MRLLLLLIIFSATSAFAQQTDFVFTHVDQPAMFPGGSQAMMKWLGENISYPDSVFTPDAMCTSFSFRFIVEADGTITGVENRRACSPEADGHFARIISGMPRWEPARISDVPVRSYFTLPIKIHPK